MKKAMAIVALFPTLCFGTVDQLARVPNPLMELPGMRPLPSEIIYDVTNAPNPFDTRKPGLEGQTRISYQLAGDWAVDVTIYDLLGHRVKRWHFGAGDQGGQQGMNEFVWDGTNDAGQKVSKGGYLTQI